ncbi:DUF1266 domain-containing protein [Gordonia shandongensis]|uniref:DUF1266 domain-containing protein n=1 Tax=Gordonia shandongensis TaxID=376351 RepID=UPI00041F3FE1|nr:DUF1266 domain-containing protein [Gordonia shandongensis]
MALFDRIRDRVGSTSGDTPEQIAAAVDRDYTDHVLPVDPAGTLYGPIAQGLALAGPMAAPNEVRWNSLTDLGNWGHDRQAEYALTEDWGISTEEYWMEVLGALLDGRYGDSVAYHAAKVRTEAKRRRDLSVLDDAAWAQELSAEAQRLEAPPEWAQALVESIVDIRTAENTLRRARLLAADEEVEALDGYDLVRVGNVAKWGLAMGWGGPHVVRNVALAARDSVLVNHSSWRSYALSVAAGRIVTYPDTFGRQVVQTIEWVRPFMDSAHSPWNNLPFPTEPVLGDD